VFQAEADRVRSRGGWKLQLHDARTLHDRFAKALSLTSLMTSPMHLQLSLNLEHPRFLAREATLSVARRFDKPFFNR
jgi:hypothetical protein